MQLIAVDIGNSSTKIALVNRENHEQWCVRTEFQPDNSIELANFLDQLKGPAFWSASSVSLSRQKSLQQWIAENRPSDRFHEICESDVPLKSNVESRTQLGRDRLVSAWIAVQLNFQSGPIIVVDAGTAVTIDLIDENLVFQGGHIFPGAESNFRQLAQNTDALPDLSSEKREGRFSELKSGAIGKSTSTAILQGVYQAQIGAIRGTVEAISSKQIAPPAVFATGGGIKDIAEFLPADWNYVPDLVLLGAKDIGRILMANV